MNTKQNFALQLKEWRPAIFKRYIVVISAMKLDAVKEIADSLQVRSPEPRNWLQASPYFLPLLGIAVGI